VEDFLESDENTVTLDFAGSGSSLPSDPESGEELEKWLDEFDGQFEKAKPFQGSSHPRDKKGKKEFSIRVDPNIKLGKEDSVDQNLITDQDSRQKPNNHAMDLYGSSEDQSQGPASSDRNSSVTDPSASPTSVSKQRDNWPSDSAAFPSSGGKEVRHPGPGVEGDVDRLDGVQGFENPQVEAEPKDPSEKMDGIDEKQMKRWNRQLDQHTTSPFPPGYGEDLLLGQPLPSNDPRDRWNKKKK